jgi:hypothetical protein
VAVIDHGLKTIGGAPLGIAFVSFRFLSFEVISFPSGDYPFGYRVAIDWTNGPNVFAPPLLVTLWAGLTGVQFDNVTAIDCGDYEGKARFFRIYSPDTAGALVRVKSFLLSDLV